MKIRFIYLKSLLTIVTLGLSHTCLSLSQNTALDTVSTTKHQSQQNTIIIPPNPNELSSLWQLRQQELQLEEQLLQTKKQILQIERQQALSKTEKSTSDLGWIDYSSSIPKDATVAALAEQKPVYICRSEFMEGIHPGQWVGKRCLITYGGRTYLESKYQVLAGKHQVIWKPGSAIYSFQSSASNPISGDAVSTPNFPIQGGFEQNRPLYICRAIFENLIHVGKVVGDQCMIGVQETEVSLPTYEVLFY